MSSGGQQPHSWGGGDLEIPAPPPACKVGGDGGGDTCTPTATGLPLPGLSVTAGSLPAPALVFFFSLCWLPARVDGVTLLGQLRALSASFKAKIYQQDE